MQNILNSSPLLLKKNSFLDVKPLKNETQEIETQSNISLKKDNSVSFGQINESQVVQRDEDSSKNIGQDSDNIRNDFSKDSTFPMFLNEKKPLSNSSINENNSIDKFLSFNQNKDTCYLNELNELDICFNMPKLNEDMAKMSGYSQDSFLSDLEISPNQELIRYDNNELNIYIIDGGKNDSMNSNIREAIDEMKETANLNKNDSADEKKK